MAEPQQTAAPYIGIESLALAGYRSFGAEPQRFPRFGKLNILIGQNNSGKSNVLRFIHERMQAHHSSKVRQLSDVDRHIPGGSRFMQGLAMSQSEDIGQTTRDVADRWGWRNNLPEFTHLGQLLNARKNTAGTKELWCDMDENGNPFSDEWVPALRTLDDQQLSSIWIKVSGTGGGGDRETLWTPGIIQRLAIPIPTFQSHMIPAIRKVGAKGSTSDTFSGEGLIERLARLQNPPANRQQDKAQFRSIRDFVRVVVSSHTAEIEIPHDRDTINVEIDGKTLPLESLGTGIQEVIILAAASTILESCVVCMEEPELHLNPLLQKKLMRYLQERTSNQYFIATHSAALMDTLGAEVYHLSMRDGCTQVERKTSDRHHSDICRDLGYHPSDLLQSNCVIWVEGPSDRIYMEWWISALDQRLIEGIHYSLMFYGGRLASHLSADDAAASEFILLRRLNRHGVMVMDSDKASEDVSINATKTRLKTEFDKGPGHAFVTEGREIENYIEPETLKSAIASTHPNLEAATAMAKFDNTLTLINSQGAASKATKVRVATAVRASGEPNLDRFDLRQQITRIVDFIVASNPPIEAV